jgi:hypothetical protein
MKVLSIIQVKPSQAFTTPNGEPFVSAIAGKFMKTKGIKIRFNGLMPHSFSGFGGSCFLIWYALFL